MSNEERYSIVSLISLDRSVNKPDCNSNEVKRYGPIIKIIKTSLRFLSFFIKDQDIANDINPKIIKIFSFKVKFKELLKKSKYTITKEIIIKGINFDVIKIMLDLYLFELNKYLMPMYEFKEKIEDI